MSIKSYSTKTKSGKESNQREKSPSMYLLEVCVSPNTSTSSKWQQEFVPLATQLLLSNRPAYIIVRNSWNPVPFEHYPSRPETCRITTKDGTSFVWTDAKIWSRQEIRATCEDCDFVSGNMWFYIPNGAPRSPDELFLNVVDPLLEWSRQPSGVGEAIGSAEESLGLLYWNIPENVVDVAAAEMRKLASKIGIVIENEDVMVIDCLEEEFGAGEEDEEEDDVDDVAPRNWIPFRDWFWIGIILIILQLLYLASKLEGFRAVFGM